MTKIEAANSAALQDRANTWLTINKENEKKLNGALKWEPKARRRGTGLIICIPLAVIGGMVLEKRLSD